LADYIEIELTLHLSPEPDHELILAWLSHYGFEGFREEEGRILAYIPSQSYGEKDFKAFLEDRKLLGKIASLEVNSLPDRNWNELWERSYQPVTVGSACVVRAPFHPAPAGVEYDIIIAPKMSFGTAHHETTRGMIQMMFSLDLKEKAVLDLGCGTGILAILAEKMGAATVLALDNDPWAYRNAIENLALNDCHRTRVLQTELSFISQQTFDLILSNINLNSLLGLMDQFPGRLRPGSLLMLSGFFSEDLSQIDQTAARNGLEFVADQVMNNWMVALYRKAV
jgi:ribosomal protein L11 methyltransferase